MQHLIGMLVAALFIAFIGLWFEDRTSYKFLAGTIALFVGMIPSVYIYVFVVGALDFFMDLVKRKCRCKKAG